MKNLILVLIFSLTSFATFASDPFKIAWVAARVGDKMYTNLDVESFITRSELSDMEKTALFRKANRNYSQYLKLKKEMIYGSDSAVYNDGIKKLIYREMVKQQALREMSSASRSSRRSSGVLGGLGDLFGGGNNRSSAPVQRRAFNVTEDQFYKMVREKEDKVLKVYLDEKLGIVIARQKFGEELKKADYPHKADDKNEDVYWRWYNSMKNALRADILSREVKKWEAIQAMKSNPSMHVRPTDIRSFYTSTSDTINKMVQNRDMSYKDWTSLISKHPEMSVLMQDTKILSLGGASPYTILQEDSDKFQELKKEILEKFAPQLTEGLSEKILAYEAKAQILANKYSSAEKLFQLYEEHNRKIDDQSLMLAKLYRLAATIKEGKADRAHTRDLINTLLRNSLQTLQARLEENSFYANEDYKKYLFHMIVEAELVKLTSEQIGEEDIYTSRAFNMGIWFTKFLANKTAFATNVRIKTGICAFNTFECQKKIQDWLKMEDFNRGIQQYRQRKIRDEFRGQMSLNPDGSRNLYGEEAVSFVLD